MSDDKKAKAAAKNSRNENRQKEIADNQSKVDEIDGKLTKLKQAERTMAKADKQLENVESTAKSFQSGLSDNHWRGQKRNKFDLSFSKVIKAIKKDVNTNQANKTAVQTKIQDLENKESVLKKAISDLQSAME